MKLQNLSWNRDRKNGPSGTMTSEFIMMNFVTTPDNVSKYQNTEGDKSKEHCHNII